METRYIVEPYGFQYPPWLRGKWRVRLETREPPGKWRNRGCVGKNRDTWGMYDCLSHALFFGLPYGKGSKLRRRPELEGGRAVQVWA